MRLDIDPLRLVLLSTIFVSAASFSAVLDRPSFHPSVEICARRIHLFASKGNAKRRRRPTVSARRKRRGKKQCTFASRRDVSVDTTALLEDSVRKEPDPVRSASVARLPSLDAAAEIRGAPASPGGGRGLLVITTDASGGSGRYAGTCAVLRRCGAGAERGRGESGDRRHWDGVVVASRRTRNLQSLSGLPPEIAAVGLGSRAALENVPAEDRKRVIFVTDCERAISFFCSPEQGRGSMARVSSQEASCRRAVAALAGDAIEGISMCKVRSTSRSGQDGFFDHAAADIISAATRSTANGESYIVASSLTVPLLRKSDLDWLENSEEKPWELVPQGKPKGVSGIKDRIEGLGRLQRCRARIEDEFGISSSQL